MTYFTRISIHILRLELLLPVCFLYLSHVSRVAFYPISTVLFALRHSYNSKSVEFIPLQGEANANNIQKLFSYLQEKDI